MKTKTFSKILVGTAEKGDPSGSPSNHKSEDSPSDRSASLYDDTISDKSGVINWKLPVGAALIVIVLGVVLASYFSSSSGHGSASVASPDTRDPSQLERLVEEAKHKDDEGAKKQVLKPLKDADRSGQSNPVIAVSKIPDRKTSKEPRTRQESATAPAEESVDSSHTARVRTAAKTSSKPVKPEAVATEADPLEGASATNVADQGTTPVASGVENQVSEEEASPDKASEFTDEELSLYDRLLKESPVAAKLASGGYSTLEFQSWRIVQRARREIWYDLISNWSNGGPEVHFIWAVDRETGATRPLSQAARNLEATGNAH